MKNQYKLFNSIEEAYAILPVNKTRLLLIDGQRICLARTPAGLFATEDSCPHLGESLSKGTVNYLNEVVCPWHSYRFSLHNGAECKNRSRELKIYPVEITEDGVFLEL